MEDQPIARRQLLRSAGAAAGGAVVTGLVLSSPAHADGGGEQVMGSWMLTRADDPPSDTTLTTTVVSLAAGGVAISKDISPAGPPGTGAWRAKGKRVNASIWFGFPGEGGPDSPGVTISVDLTGRVRGDRFDGTYQYAVFIPDGTQVASGTGTFGGTKIEV